MTSLALLVAHPLALFAQLSPNADWRTIRTTHFYVHFTPPLETMARRAAAEAERAYAGLAATLTPPRGMIDLVISDDVDYTQGYATPFPSNRIVLYANPPVDESALRLTADWTQLGVTHELTHIFHLDRVRGLWALGQRVMGRAPFLFPNVYAPGWLTEGLAVYEETRLTPAGRAHGSEHAMIARAAAIDHAFPGIGDVSRAAPRFPFGEAAYAYGSLFIDHLARAHGDSAVRAFVERSSAQIIPYLLDRPSSRAFGVSFSAAWRAWRDSITASLADSATVTPLAGWRDLTRDGVFVSYPRWLGDTALVYSGTPGRESYGAYRVDLAGRRRRIGRRNSPSPNVLLPDGGLLFAQQDFTNPYQLRGDLFVQRGRRQTRITHGARLAAPDVRRDGAIVAVQTIPGGTRLVRVSRDGRRIAPITSGGLDEQWTEPRWSYGGDRIAAVRWRRGGVSDIVVLDTAGTVLRVVASGTSIQATPSWAPGDAAIVYTSDRGGVTEVYLAPMDPNAAPDDIRRLSHAVTGLFEPQPTPHARSEFALLSLAAVRFRGDGYHLGVGLPDVEPTSAPPGAVASAAGPEMPPPSFVETPATRYSPWRSLAPRYWMPVAEAGMHAGRPRLGGTTSGSDAVGRHSYGLTAELPTDNSGVVGSFAYQYAGLGLPIVQLTGDQGWERYLPVISRSVPADTLGEVRRRIAETALTATWLRQRVRSSLSATVGGGLEQRFYAGVPRAGFAPPRPLLQLVDTTGLFSTAYYPLAVAAFRFSNVQRPALSISPEDGITVAGTARERWRAGHPETAAPSVVGAATAYRSLDLPGFAHHVLAVRAAGGVASSRTTSYFEVGGTSGSGFDVIPGFTVGEGRKDFGVRGFAPASAIGTRAVSGSAEYRLPLRIAGRGLGVLPFFVDRASLSLFGDAGAAWCPFVSRASPVCRPEISSYLARRWLSSVGGELDLTAAVLSYDEPYRFRIGAAVPLRNPASVHASKVSAYFAAGLSF